MSLWEEVESFKSIIVAYIAKNEKSINPNTTPPNMQDILEASCRHPNVEKDIKIVKSPFPTEMFKSFLLRGKKSAIIIIRENLTPEEKNFAILKEISHLIFDKEHLWSSDASHIIRSVVDEQDLPEELACLLDENTNPAKMPSLSEIKQREQEIAPMIALELACPSPALWEQDRKRLDEHKPLPESSNLKTNHHTLSIEYKLPFWSISNIFNRKKKNGRQKTLNSIENAPPRETP